MESNPDDWFRNQLYPRTEQALDAISPMLGTSAVGNTVFVDNASGGVNAVIRSVAERYDRTAAIVALNTAYGMVKNVLAYVKRDAINENRPVYLINITLPATPAAIVAEFEAGLAAITAKVALCSFSHVVSVPGFILPVADLTAACRRVGALTLIDGAHALGQVEVDVGAIGCEFYVTNLHKWMYVPRSEALLYVSPAAQSVVAPPVVSREGRGRTPMEADFSYVGTRDYTARFTVRDAMAFRQSIGGEAAIRAYTHALARDGGAALAARWGTEVLFADDAMYGAMVDVRLPTTDGGAAAKLPMELMARYATFVPSYQAYWPGAKPGAWYVRVSAQVYLDQSDFSYLADAVAAILGV